MQKKQRDFEAMATEKMAKSALSRWLSLGGREGSLTFEESECRVPCFQAS